MATERGKVQLGLLSVQGGEFLVQCGKTKLLGRDTLEKIKEHLKCNVVTMDGKPVDECYYWMSQAILWGLHDYMPGKRKTKNDYKILFWESLHTLHGPRPDVVKLEREMKKKYYAGPLLTIAPAVPVTITIKQEPLEIDSLESTLDVLAISNIEQKHTGAHTSSILAQKSPNLSQSFTSFRAEPSAASSAALLPHKQQSSSTTHNLPCIKRPSVSDKQPSSTSKQPLSSSKQPLSSSKQPLSSSKRSSESSKQPSSSIERPSSSSKQSSSSKERPSVSKTPLSSTQTNASGSSSQMSPPQTKAKQHKSARQRSIRIVDPSPEPSFLPGGGELDHKTPVPHGTANMARPDIRCYSGIMSEYDVSSEEPDFSDSSSMILSVHDGCDRAMGHVSTGDLPFVFALHRLAYGEWSRCFWGEVCPDGQLGYTDHGWLRVYQDGRIEAELRGACYQTIRYHYKGMMVGVSLKDWNGVFLKDSLRLMEKHEEELLKLAAKLSR